MAARPPALIGTVLTLVTAGCSSGVVVGAVDTFSAMETRAPTAHTTILAVESAEIWQTPTSKPVVGAVPERFTLGRDPDGANAVRSVLHFNLGALPSSARVHRALLVLVKVDTEPHDPSVEIVVGLATRAWPQPKIWDDQPPTAESRSGPFGDGPEWSIEVTDTVDQWVQHTSANHGFILGMAPDQEPALLQFHSSKAPHIAQRPRLDISYE